MLQKEAKFTSFTVETFEKPALIGHRDACDDCAEPLVILVKEMLQRDPAKRIGSMREVASRLEQMLQGL